ncbi:MAG: OmpH family outer membrane protein [Rhodobacterales bacterium]|nr:OmpH family outer membrane protein [Rhodobacterales bacterium]
MRLLGLAGAILLLLAGGPLVSQDTGGTSSNALVRSPVLTIDPDRLFAETVFGQRVTAEVKRDAAALEAENQQIEDQLTAEERSLTERRPTMEVEDFRVEAEAFDARVQAIRAEQDAKERALQQAVTEGRSKFLEAARPILAQIMIESGAAVVLDLRSVFLGVGAVDITDAAIKAVDAALGDGTAIPDEAGDIGDAPAP